MKNKLKHSETSTVLCLRHKTFYYCNYSCLTFELRRRINYCFFTGSICIMNNLEQNEMVIMTTQN